MTKPDLTSRRGTQAGFSMVEMLMAAFILAIGILGLSMLQTMSLKAARGSKSLNNAVKLADRMMDQIEAEGRLSWLNITDNNTTPPTALANLQYVGKGTRYLGFQETLNTSTNLVSIAPATTAPVGTKPSIGGTLRYVATVTEGTATSAGTGKASVYSVTVEFVDDLNKTGAKIVRSVNISRSIIHG